MKIKKETFLNDLQMVKAGLSPREFIEQSSCFVFKDGQVMTFNDEVACRKSIKDLDDRPIKITGAVQATSLLTVLEKLDDPELMVRENEDGELEFRGKGKGFGVTKEAEVFLPIDRVEEPEHWRPLPADFAVAIRMVQHCVSLDETKFMLTCIHLHPNYIEACDNKQLLRYEISFGLKHSALVRGAALSHLTDLGMHEVGITKSWIHFRNKAGLIFSCRKYMEEYPSLDSILDFKGRPIRIPKRIAEASERAAIFATDKSGDPLLVVELSAGRMRVKGEGVAGWYIEDKKIAYDGPVIQFLIAPELLHLVSEKYSDAQISKSKLKATGPHWEYVTVLGKMGEKKEKEQPEEEAVESPEE
jgi:hypothetical protein